MKKRFWVSGLLLAAFISLAILYINKPIADNQKIKILISAASSLKDSLTEIESLYESSHKNIDLAFNFGSSGTLQQQIEQGAPSDLFLSAGDKHMKALSDQGLVEPAYQSVLLHNDLVLITPAQFQRKFTDIKELVHQDYRFIAIGHPETVPAGGYAQEALTAAKLWGLLKDKLVYAKDVRQVLNYVETGNADAGIVYKTDALTSKKVITALTVPAGMHQQIVYPAAVLKQSEHPAEAKEFYLFLKGSKAQQVFKKYGFKLPRP